MQQLAKAASSKESLVIGAVVLTDNCFYPRTHWLLCPCVFLSPQIPYARVSTHTPIRVLPFSLFSQYSIRVDRNKKQSGISSYIYAWFLPVSEVVSQKNTKQALPFRTTEETSRPGKWKLTPCGRSIAGDHTGHDGSNRSCCPYTFPSRRSSSACRRCRRCRRA